MHACVRVVSQLSKKQGSLCGTVYEDMHLKDLVGSYVIIHIIDQCLLQEIK